MTDFTVIFAVLLKTRCDFVFEQIPVRETCTSPSYQMMIWTLQGEWISSQVLFILFHKNTTKKQTNKLFLEQRKGLKHCCTRPPRADQETADFLNLHESLFSLWQIYYKFIYNLFMIIFDVLQHFNDERCCPGSWSSLLSSPLAGYKIVSKDETVPECLVEHEVEQQLLTGKHLFQLFKFVF